MSVLSSKERAVLATLIYADIFDYPLSLTNLHRFLIGQIVSLNELKKILASLLERKMVESRSNLFFLPGRAEIVSVYRRRKTASKIKWQIAQKIGRLLKIIPQVRLVGVSGGLAVDNADINDDIDFFIITSPNQLWFTRLLVTVILTAFGKRRLPNSVQVANKVCLNMFIDEKQLEITPHDIYFAHEVLQMRPIFWRDKVYERFLLANNWSCQFLPNWPRPNFSQLDKFEFQSSHFISSKITKIAESIARNFQLNYMAKRRTIEKITPNKLQFHPRDAHKWILERYSKRLEEFGF